VYKLRPKLELQVGCYRNEQVCTAAKESGAVSLPKQIPIAVKSLAKSNQEVVRRQPFWDLEE
jgi:hypothetical protein